MNIFGSSSSTSAAPATSAQSSGYSHGRQSSQSTQPSTATIAGLGTGGVATLGIIASCNYYAMLIGYLTVLILIYLIVSWIMSFFSSSGRDKSSAEGFDDFDDLDDEYEDDEPPPPRKRKKKKSS